MYACILWPPGMVRHCQYVSHFSVCNDTHLSHKFDAPSLYIWHTANQFVDSPFLEKDAQCTEEMTHIIAPCIYTMHASIVLASTPLKFARDPLNHVYWTLGWIGQAAWISPSSMPIHQVCQSVTAPIGHAANRSRLQSVTPPIGHAASRSRPNRSRQPPVFSN